MGDPGQVSKKIASIIVLLLLVPLGYALANYTPPVSHNDGPKILGTFTLNIEATNVEDLYAWQVLLTYDPQKLVVLEVKPGGFVGSVYPRNPSDIKNDIFMNVTFENMLLLGGSLIGETSGKSGDGLLAKVTFGYLSPEYDEPQLVFCQKPYGTRLLNSEGRDIPITAETIRITLKQR